MPHVLVVTDLPEAGGKVVYRERIASSDFESRHFTDQLAERVGWAVHDAQDLSRREEILSQRKEISSEEEEKPGPDEQPVTPGLTVLAS